MPKIRRRHEEARITRTASSWARLLSRFGTPKRPRTGTDGERLWLGPSELERVDLLLPQTTAFLLVCPKSQPISWWCADDSLPRDVAVVCGPCPTERRGLPILKALCAQARGAVFVGDMDPYSVVQYLETRRMLLAGTKGPFLLYGGVNDAWLGAMERTLSRRMPLERVQIPLSKQEVSLLNEIEEAVDLEQIIGSRGCSILRSGFKIELEGASNPALYDRKHGRWVFRYLRARVAMRGVNGHE